MRLLLSILLLVPMVSLAQLDTTPHINGQRIIWNEPDIPLGEMFILVGNPGDMHDMIIIDSLGNKILEKSSTDLGYAFYRWTPKGIMTMEEIVIDSPYYQLITWWDTTGKRLGQWIKNWRDSSKTEITYYRDGENRIRTHVEKRLSEGNRWVIKGKKHEFHPNGQLRSKGGYKFNDPFDPEACKDGVWQYFNTKGTLIREEVYGNCEIVRSIDYEEP